MPIISVVSNAMLCYALPILYRSALLVPRSSSRHDRLIGAQERGCRFSGCGEEEAGSDLEAALFLVWWMWVDMKVLRWPGLERRLRSNMFGSCVMISFLLFRFFQIRSLVVRFFSTFIVFDDFLHRFREHRVPHSVTGNRSLGAPPRKVPAVLTAVSFVSDVIAFTQSYIRSHFWRLRQDLVEHGEVFAAIDEFETLVVLPVVELVGGRDVESREERRLVGDAGEGEGRVPGSGRREVDGEGGDAVAVVNPRISILYIAFL